MSVTSIANGITEVEVPVGDECFGGCTLVLVFSVPRQTNDEFALPVDVCGWGSMFLNGCCVFV